MTYRIRISREWGCSPLGQPAISFAAGVYSVPAQISDYLAQRCLRSGIGTLVEDEVKQPAPANKKRGAAPENKLRAS